MNKKEIQNNKICGMQLDREITGTKNLHEKRGTVLNHNLKTRKCKTKAQNKQKEVNDESQIINKIESQKK